MAGEGERVWAGWGYGEERLAQIHGVSLIS